MTIAGIAWFKREQWDELRRVSEDRDKLEATWEEWVEVAESGLIRMMKSGVNVQKVAVDVDALVLWCRDQGRPCNSDARAAYVVNHLK